MVKVLPLADCGLLPSAQVGREDIGLGQGLLQVGRLAFFEGLALQELGSPLLDLLLCSFDLILLGPRLSLDEVKSCLAIKESVQLGVHSLLHDLLLSFS